MSFGMQRSQAADWTRVCLAAALFLNACGAPTVVSRTDATAPRAGGTVVFAAQEPDTLHPFRSTGTQTNALVYQVAVEGLTAASPDGSPRAVLAVDVPTTANGAVHLLADGTMTVRWTLRPDLGWSDGTRLTSADVRFTWRAVMTDPRTTTREGYELITDIETPDERTALVRYRAIDAAYTSRFDALLPRHLLEGATEAAVAAYSRAPLGTGPFRITEFVAGDHITAERNEHYRVAGQPYLDRVIFRFVSSVEAAKAQLRAGEVDAAGSLGEADAAELESDPQVHVTNVASPAVEALAFNLRAPGTAAPHPILGDLTVRRALVRATPKARIVDKLLYGRTRPGTSEIPIGWAARGGIAQESYDPAVAARLLDDAGWRRAADGVRTKDGTRLSLRIVSTTGNKLRESIEQVLVDEWRAIGVELRIANVPSAVLTAAWQSNGVRKRGDFDVLLAQAGLGVTSPDPQSYLAQRHRCDAIPQADNKGAGSNYERLCDARVDALLDDAGRTLEIDRRRDLYGQVLSILNEQAIAIWLYDRGRYDAFRTRVLGYAANGWNVATWNAAEWHVAP
ncbi:MAG: peptide ABC transporter substrate-binding protein [Chloroflexi bacterium]|nr:MAG: peptide ABC transporter substrate-binding protein [Chloroflexota bacterium]